MNSIQRIPHRRYASTPSSPPNTKNKNQNPKKSILAPIVAPIDRVCKELLGEEIVVAEVELHLQQNKYEAARQESTLSLERRKDHRQWGPVRGRSWRLRRPKVRPMAGRRRPSPPPTIASAPYFVFWP